MIKNIKPTNIILGLSILLTANLFGQTNQAKQPLIDFLDPDSQTNIIVIKNGDTSWPCPPQYTNLLSNTNLFSPAEQKLLRGVRLKYENVTTNSGPPGSVLASLNKDTNGYWVALFQYTNSDVQDEITFGWKITAKHLDKANNGYEVDVSPRSGDKNPHIACYQIKHNVMDGLCVGLSSDDHCLSWMHYSNSMAVGKWLEWWGLDNSLSMEAEFKVPYDIQKHAIPINIR
ncbi:MAG: hypothetical protein WCS94_22195 [Verrucomicrobiota bacterium]